MPDLPDLLSQGRAWAADDPDPETRADMQGLVAAAACGDASAAARLAESFGSPLQFGTAGLRAPMGTGPDRMNRAVVMRASAGLAAWLHEGGEKTVVIGYDARRMSAQFASDAAAVLAGAGLDVSVLPGALPTPVLAFTVRRLQAGAGVMVTASHNPAGDNGLKVYLPSGAQIASPVDAAIAAQIAAVRSVADLPVSGSFTTLGDDAVEAYIDRAASLVSAAAPRDIAVAFTPLHGVGGRVLLEAVARAGFQSVQVCAEQLQPDAGFPTVEFPNPEEPGAMDLVMALAARVQAHVAIALDPDADRCAVAVAVTGGFRRLSGDEVGVLLGWWILERARRGWSGPVSGAFATSIVSSSLLGRIAADAGVGFEQTLTGFKWISRAPELVYGYEEALGYCVDPAHVLDKDGITAALLVCELVAALAAEGRTVQDVLDSLAAQFGRYLTAQVSVRVGRIDEVAPVVDRLIGSPPASLGGLAVTEVADLSRGWHGLPATPGVRIAAGEGPTRARVVVRPSGTEPKLKAYVEVVLPVGSPAEDAERLLREVNDAVRRLL